MKLAECLAVTPNVQLSNNNGDLLAHIPDLPMAPFVQCAIFLASERVGTVLSSLIPHYNCIIVPRVPSGWKLIQNHR